MSGPDFLPPRGGISYQQAAAEALAHASAGHVMLETLSFYAPAFGAVYVVNGWRVFRGRIEPDATTGDAGQVRDFSPVAFRAVRPEDSATAAAAELLIEVDNAARALWPQVRQAQTAGQAVEVVLRTYDAANASAPIERPPLRMVLRSAEARGAGTVQLRAGMPDLGNRRFPRVFYRAYDFPGLTT